MYKTRRTHMTSCLVLSHEKNVMRKKKTAALSTRKSRCKASISPNIIFHYFLPDCCLKQYFLNSQYNKLFSWRLISYFSHTRVRTGSRKHVRTYAHTDGPDGRAGVQMCLHTDGLQRAYAHMHSHPRTKQVTSKVRQKRNDH